jgi:hypothetical protein
MVATNKKSHSQHIKGKHSAAEKKSPARSHTHAQPSAIATIDRRSNRDRRSETDQRTQNIPAAFERRSTERRAKVSRRRQIDPTTCERDYSPEEIEFTSAMDDYKRRNGRMFPTCSEVLEVIKTLGYGKLPRTESPAMPNVDPSVLADPNLSTVG